MNEASIDIVDRQGKSVAMLSGDWVLAALPEPLLAFESQLVKLSQPQISWDLSNISRMDSALALLLWRAWQRKWPESITVSPENRLVIDRVKTAFAQEDFFVKRFKITDFIHAVGETVLSINKGVLQLIALLGQLILDVFYLCAHPRDIPWREFSATLCKSGARAMPVTALVGFLIGVVLSFLSALQLKNFGADIFIVNLLGISIVRELGPIIVAVLIAGRSGSAMTAQIGVMRVTEELDALSTMGISRSLRLVLPKILALSVATPLLVIWCSIIGIMGGMVAAYLELGLEHSVFITALPRVVPVSNLWIGLGKGVVFGFLIALIACHFGLKVKPNTESLSARTTTSVVTSITIVIVADAIFAVLTRSIGMPL